MFETITFIMCYCARVYGEFVYEKHNIYVRYKKEKKNSSRVEGKYYKGNNNITNESLFNSEI